MYQYLSLIFHSPVYYYLSALVWLPAAYFHGKIKGHEETKAIYTPVLNRVLESNTDSIKLLCSVRDEMRQHGIVYYLSEEDQPHKPTEH